MQARESADSNALREQLDRADRIAARAGLVETTRKWRGELLARIWITEIRERVNSR